MSTDLISIRPMPENQATLRKLDELEEGLRDKALARMVRAGAKPLQTIMKSTAPDDPSTPGSSLALAVNTMALKNNQRVKVGKGRETRANVGDGVQAVVVGPNVSRKTIAGIAFSLKPLQRIALWLEGGTKPHLVGKRKIRLSLGGGFVTGPIQHPGVRPRRWMQNTLTAGGPQILSGFYEGLAAFVRKVSQ